MAEYTGNRGEYQVDVIVPEAPALKTLGVAASATVRIPGGVQVGAAPQQAPTSDCRIIINNLIPSITIALGPLGFLFCLLNIVMKIIDCVNAVPKSISMLNPGPILDAIVKLVAAIKCLVQLLPQLSMLFTIYDIICLLVSMLECLITQLMSLKAIQQQILDALNSADQDQDLKNQLNVANQQSSVMMNQTVTILNPLVPIFAVINIFMPLFGQEPVSFEVPQPDSPIDTVLEYLTMIHDTLATIKLALEILLG